MKRGIVIAAVQLMISCGMRSVLLVLLVAAFEVASPRGGVAQQAFTQCSQDSGRCWQVSCGTNDECRTYRLSRIRKLCDRSGENCRPMRWACNAQGQDCAWKAVTRLPGPISIPNDGPFPELNWNF